MAPPDVLPYPDGMAAVRGRRPAEARISTGDSGDQRHRQDGDQVRQLRGFVHVAEQGSISGAADVLGTAQPAMSRLLFRLEERLGLRLFDRTSRGVVLTAVGAALLPHAARVVDALCRFDAAAGAASAGEVGLLRVGTTEGAGLLTAETLRLFQLRQPGVQVRLQHAHTASKLAAVRSGRLEMAFVRNPGAVPGVVSDEVLRQPLVVALGVDHPLGSQSAVTLAELADYPLLLTPEAVNRGVHDAVLQLLASAGVHPREVAPLTNEEDALVVVASSEHWMLVSRSSVRTTPAAVTFLPLRDASAEVVIHLAWRSTPGPQDAAVRAFRRAAADAGRQLTRPAEDPPDIEDPASHGF